MNFILLIHLIYIYYFTGGKGINCKTEIVILFTFIILIIVLFKEIFLLLVACTSNTLCRFLEPVLLQAYHNVFILHIMSSLHHCMSYVFSCRNQYRKFYTSYSSLSLLQCLIIWNAAYYDTRSISKLLQSIRNLYWIIQCLDIVILFSYPSSIVITRDYCSCMHVRSILNDSLTLDSECMHV